MSKQNNTNEEDYLDKLLNSVLSGNSEEVNDDIFDDELNGLSEFDDDFFQNVEESLNEEPEEVMTHSETMMEELAKEVIADKEESMEELTSLAEEDILQETADSDAVKTGEETVEQDMQGLLDILGVEEENAEAAGEIETLEKKGKKEKKKKDKKKKKLFGKKKKESEESMAVDVALDLMEQKGMEQLEGESDSLEEAGTEEPAMSLMDALESGQDSFESLDELTSMESLDDIPDISEKPKKEKKEKKPKKAKKAKLKKAKKRKPKKAKGPKAPSEVIPFSGKAMGLCLSIGALIILMAFVGGHYTKYNTSIKNASTYYVNQNYGKAYSELATLTIKEKDEYFYNQVQTVMYVYHNYEVYENMTKLEYYADALDSLLNGVKMYDKYKDAGREDYNCFEDMTVVLGWIDTALQEEFGITESEAREINLLGSGYDYAYRVVELAAEAEERNNSADDSNN